MYLKSTLYYILLYLFLLCSSCQDKEKANIDKEIQAGTPVTITKISKNTLSETIELNAKSTFLLKTAIKSVSNGYLKNIKFKQGDFVNKGDLLMKIVTKEAHIIGNDINKIDTSFHFKGEIAIVSPGSGFISQLNFQNGDYVQDGEQIATISDAKSFAFILELPYELTNLVKSNRNIQLCLADGSKLIGSIEKPLPMVDEASQTQNYLISVKTNKMIPENLLAKVIFIKSVKQNASSVPKAALLSNETQNSFWIMKLLNDTTAVKIPVKKGIETDERVEILSPTFLSTDRILVSGNYGLADTALVVIKK